MGWKTAVLAVFQEYSLANDVGTGSLLHFEFWLEVDLPQVDLMNFRVEFVWSRSGGFLGGLFRKSRLEAGLSPSCTQDFEECDREKK